MQSRFKVKINSIFVVLLMTLSTQPAFAATILAEVKMSGGSVYPIGNIRTQIFDDGKVVAIDQDCSRIIATLEQTVLAQFKNEITTLNPTPLKLKGPDRPCYDVPDESFRIFRNGETIEIEKTDRCRKYLMADGEEIKLLIIMKGLDRLAFHKYYPNEGTCSQI